MYSVFTLHSMYVRTRPNISVRYLKSKRINFNRYSKNKTKENNHFWCVFIPFEVVGTTTNGNRLEKRKMDADAEKKNLKMPNIPSFAHAKRIILLANFHNTIDL